MTHRLQFAISRFRRDLVSIFCTFPPPKSTTPTHHHTGHTTPLNITQPTPSQPHKFQIFVSHSHRHQAIVRSKVREMASSGTMVLFIYLDQSGEDLYGNCLFDLTRFLFRFDRLQEPELGADCLGPEGALRAGPILSWKSSTKASVWISGKVLIALVWCLFIYFYHQ